ncbi:response regulator [Leptolyngbya cf. ectocarpi LEGE 11479]|uniref:Response regulator n=1 Tax=Leptolyngbya cf. ectocarpi LEGE 11479 TaxID=1828722 RepID=A0A928ZXU3_LEPEC|nr:response regulator [Leptolyngbya ectocarpi]MBE9069418.1 response regulator [Leptolyngbya cf. ectocarpi LEGE 11479]
MPKILLVEDNALNRKMLDRKLQHCGYEMLLATDGDQGVALAIHHQPDLIIMDTELPVMDGWQAIKVLKASTATAHIPVIALTTNTKSGNWKTALKVGCNDYDTKPIVLKRLLGKVEALLGVNSSPANLATAPLEDLGLQEFAFNQAEAQNNGFLGLKTGTLAPILNSSKSSNGLLNGCYQTTEVLHSDAFGQRILAKDVKGATPQPVLINTFNLPVENASLLSSVRDFLASEMSFLKVVSRQDDIATCLDYFEENEVFYWVQEHVLGRSLVTELGSAQSMGYVLQLTHSLLSNVHPFHQGQMVHCECHPDSFVRRQSDNRIVLVDYGLLTRMFVNLRSHSLAYRQALLKPRQYQAAEQRVGNPQLNSDIYSIGMIVLQSLTGQSPEWLANTVSQRNLTGLVKADPKIVKLFERMVSPNEQLRFKAAGEALAALPLGLMPKKTVYQQAFSS